MTRIILTGAAGFVGSHIAEAIVLKTDWNILALDSLTYAGRLDRLGYLPKNRIKFLYHDFRYPLSKQLLSELRDPDYVIHNGAETHVPRSIAGSDVFVRSNITGTFNMLEAARSLCPGRFIYISTDEVFGPARGKPFKESDTLAPSNPYSATKAGGEYLARAYRESFRVPVMVTRTMNMFGERQHPEKFIPMVLRKVLHGETVDVHCDRKLRSGTRQWLHASVQADALLFLLAHGITGETYHVAGEERSNYEIVQMIGECVPKAFCVRYVNAFDIYPGHDISYAIDDTKLRAMGWKSPIRLQEALYQFVKWTIAHPEWLEE